MSRYFFNLEQKEDTPEKLAKVAGKPTKHHLFAYEINMIGNRILTLWELIKSTNSNFNLLLTAENSIDLGTITTSMLTVLNSQSRLYDAPFFVKFKFEGIDYIYSYVGETGNFGSGGTPLLAEQFLLISKSDEPFFFTQRKEISGRLLQNETYAPDLIEIYNSFGTISLIRADVGNYVITLNGLTDPDKVEVLLIPENNDFFVQTNVNDNYPADVTINIYTGISGEPQDDVLKGFPIKITVYE